MKQVFWAGFIILILIILNIFFQYNSFIDRKNLVINTHVELEKYIVSGIARSANKWFSYNLLKLGRDKSEVEDEVFKYFVDPVLLFRSGDAWIYNRRYVIYDKSGDFPDIYRNKSIKEIFKIQKKSGASHYDELVDGVINATDGSGWYLWLPEKGREWVAWSSIKVGDDTWTIGLSTPEPEILEHNGMREYLARNIMNSSVITILLIIIFVIIYRDKKNEIKNNQKLHEAIEAAEDANKTKSRFLANITHEIRTPITGIIGITHLMGKSGSSDLQKEYIGLIKSSSEYLLETIDQLLDISRIEAGKYSIESEAFSPIDVLDMLVRIFKISAGEKGLDFVYSKDQANSDCIVTGDPKVLRHIVTNLLGNAVKYTEKGNIRLWTKLENMSEDNISLTIEIADTGAGIPEESLNRIFDYFYQVNSSGLRNTKGTGLGLAIVKDLVQLSGGVITVDSKEGKGSSFKVTLFYEKSSDEPGCIDREKLISIEAPHHEGRGRSPLKILFAEDDRVSAIYIKTILEKISNEVTHVNNGIEAFRLWEMNAYDVIFLDAQMPFMNGLETLKRIRSEERKKGTQCLIAIISAYTSNEEKSSFFSSGADEYLQKPVSVKQLTSVIDRYYSLLSEHGKI